MGKKNKRASKKPKGDTIFSGTGPKGNVATSKYSIDQLLDKAEEYIDSFDFELAQKFCQRALEQDVDNIRALETSGTLLLEVGETEKAKSCFGRAVELSPDKGHSKYMYLGQLMVGMDAIQYFKKGIDLMEETLAQEAAQAAGATAFPESELTVKDVSSAYCAIAEIYLTDSCMDEDADVQCRTCLERAVEKDPENPEAYQLFASYWLSKEDKQKAKELLEKGVSLWLPALKEAEKPEGAEVDPVQLCPLSYPARMTAAKLLIEVTSYDIASEILELLLDEEDQVVEVWYLLGWLNFLQGADYHGNARYYLKQAVEVKKKTGFDDAEVIAHIEKLLDELGPGEDEDKDEPAEGDEDEDEDGSSEDEMEVDNKENGMHH